MATSSDDNEPQPQPQPAKMPTAPSATDVEDPPSANFTVTSVVRRWKREDLLKKSTLLLRALAWLFSLISFIIMASNKHGDWNSFDRYEEYKYCLAIAILAFLYSMAQVVRQLHRFSTGKDVISRQAVAAIIDFAGDQIMAYLLMSALSAAIPITNTLREGADNLFTDASSAAISMAFFAFLALALSALVSGYKLSNQNYI